MNILIGYFYFINPLFSIPLIAYDYKSSKKIIRTSIWVALVMAYIAYYAQAINQGDIETYTSWLELYRGIPLHQCFDKIYDGLYAMDLFFWIMARLPNERLLVSTVAFVLFFLDSYMVLRFFKDRSLKGNTCGRVLVSVLLIIPFYYYISAMRSSIALTLAFFGVFLELYCKKKLRYAIPFYILAIMTHRSAVVIVLIRIGMIVFKKRKWLYGLLLGSVVALLGTGKLQILANLGLKGVIGETLDKALEYSSLGAQSQDSWQIMVSNSFSAKIWLIYFSAILIALLILAVRRVKEVDKSTKQYHSFCIVIIMTVLGMMFFPNRIYLRYLAASIGFFAGFAYEMLLNSQGDSRIKKQRCIVIYAIVMVGFILQMYNMFLSIDSAFFFKHVLRGFFNIF